MKKRDFLKTAGAAAGLCLAGSSFAAAGTRTVTDHAGRRVTLPQKVEHVAVASIFPLAALIALFLGSAEKITAMHQVSKTAALGGLLGELFPEVKKADTSFMSGSSLNAEALLVQKPDAVFVNAGDARTIASLEAAGIPAIAVSTSKWDYDAMRTLLEWVKLLEAVFPGEGKTSASRLEALGKKISGRVQSRLKAVPEKDRAKAFFLFTYDGQKIVTSGRHFFGQYWSRASGMKNTAEGVEAKNANAAVSMEDVWRWNPDCIFITNFTKAVPEEFFSGKYPEWKAVKAVREKRVYKMPLGTYRTYVPAAETPFMPLWFAKKAYPELFSDVSAAEEAVKFFREAFSVQLSEAQAKKIFA